MATTYLLDANVFIQAKNSYYAFPICPGFWASLLGHHKPGRLCSIDYVRQELLRLNDELADWVKDEVPAEYFCSTQVDEVRAKYRKIIIWSQRNPQFTDPAKADFAASADGWLVAYAWTNNMVIVTQEQLRPDVKIRIPIPNVCKEFGVRYTDTFLMLEALRIKFDWND